VLERQISKAASSSELSVQMTLTWPNVATVPSADGGSGAVTSKQAKDENGEGEVPPGPTARTR
jgi:hypothetical protein